MKILAIEKDSPGLNAETWEPFLKLEAIKVWELYQAGVIREAYVRQDRQETVLVLECVDLDEAHEILNSLLLVQEGLITFDVIPLKPFSGFSRLFETQQKLVVTGNSKVRVTLFF